MVTIEQVRNHEKASVTLMARLSARDLPLQEFQIQSKRMPLTPPVVLTIAGFDPSSGAGITADIKTIAAHGCYGVACITALTVQSTSGVRRTEPVSAGLVLETLEELARDIPIAAVHIGMLGDRNVTSAVAGFLAEHDLPNIVLDPVLRSSSGAPLLEPKGAAILVERLLPMATAITPNVDEAAHLTGLRVTNVDEMRAAAEHLHSMGSANVVVTGGHLERAIDVLGFTTPGGNFEFEVFQSPRLATTSTHGTGCAFATTLACQLALGRSLPEAVLLTKAYVAAAIANAHPLGKGHGPVHHLYRMNEPSRRLARVDTVGTPDHD
jgi:hydroxymethylpyrimidine/phosphomethylpyrimidine kinase